MKYQTQKDNLYIHRISENNKNIYDEADPNYWIPTATLERILNNGLIGLSLRNLPLRTRSKVVKQEICKILGYPIPKSFKKTQPRFPNQSFDTYIQKSHNLQIWNEDISPDRRYVIIHLTDNYFVDKVKVITGLELQLLDNTGTLTQKYQAGIHLSERTSELISSVDTNIVQMLIGDKSIKSKSFRENPSSPPKIETLLPISEIYNRLKPLIGTTFKDVGRDQERARGDTLHRLVSQELGYLQYHDDGGFPDILNQIVEVKLQMSPTIDLGLVLPSSTKKLNLPQIAGVSLRHCDVRYVIFYAMLNKGIITLTHLFLTTGEDFFNRFSKFEGKVINKKLQIPLPNNFFS